MTFDQRTCDWIFGIIPLFFFHSTWATCVGCGASLNAKMDATSLLGKSPAEISPLLYFPTTFLQKSLAVIGLAVAIFPCVGLIMSLVAMLANWKTPSWPRIVSKLAVALSIAVLLILGVLIVLELMGFAIEM